VVVDEHLRAPSRQPTGAARQIGAALSVPDDVLDGRSRRLYVSCLGDIYGSAHLRNRLHHMVAANLPNPQGLLLRGDGH